MDTVESYKKASTYLLKPKPKQNQLSCIGLSCRAEPVQALTSRSDTARALGTDIRHKCNSLVSNDQRTAYLKTHFLLVLHVLS